MAKKARKSTKKEATKQKAPALYVPDLEVMLPSGEEKSIRFKDRLGRVIATIVVSETGLKCWVVNSRKKPDRFLSYSTLQNLHHLWSAE